jgi:tripartite-type tricarboxylate transporter receptor subunit TctC
VPYQQFPQAIGDLVAGTNQYMFITTLPVVDLIKTGKLRALAVTSPKRLSVLPDVPTVVEAGYPELIVQDWVGYMMKRGTPDPVVARMNAAVNSALAAVPVREAFSKLGAEPAPTTPTEFQQFVHQQLEYWGNVVRQSGMEMHQ